MLQSQTHFASRRGWMGAGLIALFLVVVSAYIGGCYVSKDLEKTSSSIAADSAIAPASKAPAQPATTNLPEVIGTPSQLFQQSGAEPYTRLDSVSSDSTYGYSYENPIKTGGGFPDGGLAIYRYLNALLDPDGNPISYSRLGTCCPFESHPGLLGSGQGMLDVYLIQYDDLDKPLRLYFNTFASEKLVAPKGLRYLGET